MRAFLTAFAIVLLAAAPAHAALRWSEPENLGPASGVGPRVALDARGDALAVWVDPDGALTYSWRPPRGAWTDPRALATGEIAEPAVAMSPLGRATVAWTESDRVVVASSGPGGRFRQREAPATTPRRLIGPPSLATDDAGEVAVVWSESSQPDASETAIRVALRGPGGRFGEPQTVSTEPVTGISDVQMNPAGAAVVTWTVQDNAGPRASYRPPAGRFGPEEELPLLDNNLGVYATLDEAGNVFAATSGFDYTPGTPQNATVFAVRSPLGGWAEPVTIDPDGAVSQLLAEPGGAVSFVVGGSSAAQLTTRLPTGELVGPTRFANFDARVAMALSGDMLAASTADFDPNGRGSRIAVTERPRAGAFEPERIVSARDSLGPDVALDEAGQAVVAWDHERVSGDFNTTRPQAIVREDRSLPPLPFPPDVDIGLPADPVLGADGVLKVPVRCSRHCRVTASGTLFTGGRPRALAATGKRRTLRAKHRGRVRLAFGADAAQAARAARTASVTISVRARGRSPRPVTFSRRVRLAR